MLTAQGPCLRSLSHGQTWLGIPSHSDLATQTCSYLRQRSNLGTTCLTLYWPLEWGLILLSAPMIGPLCLFPAPRMRARVGTDPGAVVVIHISNVFFLPLVLVYALE